MITPDDIKRAARRNSGARAVVAAATSRTINLVRRAKESGGVTDAIAEEEALTIIAAVINGGGAEVDGPPWSPPRYRLASERMGVTKRLELHDYTTQKDIKLYCTLSFYNDGRPAELFVRQQKEGGTIGALLDALATVMSIALQFGVPWDAMANKLIRSKFPPHGMTREEDQELVYVSSILDYVFRWADKAIEKRTSGNNSAHTDAISDSSNADESTSQSS